MKFKKGTWAAKAHMAKLRAMRGKKRRKKRAKKSATLQRAAKRKTTKRNPVKVTKARPSSSPRLKYYFIFKCDSKYNIYYLSFMSSGKFRWLPTRGDALRLTNRKLAERIGSNFARKYSASTLVFVAPDYMSHAAIMKSCEAHAGKK